MMHFVSALFIHEACREEPKKEEEESSGERALTGIILLIAIRVLFLGRGKNSSRIR